jgi:hypothetical protein
MNLTDKAVFFPPGFGAGEMSPCVLFPTTDKCPVTQVYSLLPTQKKLTLHLSRPDAVAVGLVVEAAIFDVTKSRLKLATFLKLRLWCADLLNQNKTYRAQREIWMAYLSYVLTDRFASSLDISVVLLVNVFCLSYNVVGGVTSIQMSY